MFVALDIEEHDATIVEVEGGACTRVVLDGVPSLPVAPDAFDNDDGLLIAVGVELLKLLMLLYLALGQMSGRVEGRLRLVGSEIGANVEQAVLDANDHLVFVTVGRQ